MTRRVTTALTLMLALVAGSVMAAEDRYMIDMSLWINGEKVGQPMVIVEAGKPASIMKGDEEDASGYRVELEVEHPGPGEGAPGGAIWLHVAVSELDDGRWRELADSMIGVVEGETGTISVVEGEVAQPEPENSIVYLTASPLRLVSE